VKEGVRGSWLDFASREYHSSRENTRKTVRSTEGLRGPLPDRAKNKAKNAYEHGAFNPKGTQTKVGEKGLEKNSTQRERARRGKGKLMRKLQDRA